MRSCGRQGVGTCWEGERRVDFAATVRTAGGERLRVLVEVQKARFTDEVMRFREYLGRHYADRENYDEGADGRRHRPLRAIYILGECLPRTEAKDLERRLAQFDDDGD